MLSTFRFSSFLLLSVIAGFLLALITPAYALGEISGTVSTKEEKAEARTADVRTVITTITIPGGEGGASGVTVFVAPENTSSSLNVEVFLYDQAGHKVGETDVDSAGNFVFSDLQPGQYYLSTGNRSGYIDEIYPNEICGSECYEDGYRGVLRNYVFGEPVNVMNGETSHADFILSKAAEISGRVFDQVSREPISGGRIFIYDNAGQLIDSVRTDNEGRYQSEANLPAGDYFLKATVNQGYLDQYYTLGEQDCFSCDRGDPVTVDEADSVSGIDFNLERSGRISGRIVDAKSKQTIPWVSIKFYRNEEYIGRALSDEDGYYVKDDNISAGLYTARLSAADYVAVCPIDQSCLLAKSVEIDEGEFVENVDFELWKSGVISGQVLAKENKQAVSGITVSAFSEDGNAISSAVTDEAGNYTIDQNLASGHYQICVRSNETAPGYAEQCVGEQEIDTTLMGIKNRGEAIMVKTDEVVDDIDFFLASGGTVSGTIGGDDVSQAIVYVFNEPGMIVDSFRIEDGGEYASKNGLSTGKYYIAVFNDYTITCYISVKCGFSEYQLGLPINVVRGEVTPGIDVTLIERNLSNQKVYGRVIDDASKKPISGVNINAKLIDKNAVFVVPETDSQERYVSYDIPAGEYAFYTRNFKGYLNKNHDGETCTSARSSVEGTVFGLKDCVQELNFELSRGVGFRGRLIDKETGRKIEKARIEVYDSQGDPLIVLSDNLTGVGDIDPEFVLKNETASSGLPPGQYFVRTSNTQGYIDTYYDGKPVAGASLDYRGFPITVTNQDVIPGVTLELSLEKGIRVGGEISGEDIDVMDRHYQVEFYDLNGKWLDRVWLKNGKYLSGTGLPEGQYYVVLRKLRYFERQRYKFQEGLVYGGNELIAESEFICPDETTLHWRWNCRLNVEAIQSAPLHVANDSMNPARIDFDTRSFETPPAQNSDQPEGEKSGGGGVILFSLMFLAMHVVIGRQCDGFYARSL